MSRFSLRDSLSALGETREAMKIFLNKRFVNDFKRLGYIIRKQNLPVRYLLCFTLRIRDIVSWSINTLHTRNNNTLEINIVV